MIEGSTSCCSTPKHGSLTSRYSTPDIILNLLNCLIKRFTEVGWCFDDGLRGHASSIMSMSEHLHAAYVTTFVATVRADYT